MERYSNNGGNSGIAFYEIGESYICIQFTGDPEIYKYSYNNGAGQVCVEQMKILAIKGSGLNSYINNYVKFLYVK